MHWSICMLLSDVFCSTESFVYVCFLQARYRKEQVLPNMVPWIPPVDNLLKDSTDGCALAALLHFYCPAIVRLGGTETSQALTLLSTKYYALLRGNSVRELLNQNQPYLLTHAVIVHRSAVEMHVICKNPGLF